MALMIFAMRRSVIAFFRVLLLKKRRYMCEYMYFGFVGR